MASVRRGDEEADAEAPPSLYENLEDGTTEQTGIQRFLDSKGFNLFVVFLVTFYMIVTILALTFSDQTFWSILSYVGLFAIAMQAFEVLFRVFTFIRTILCRFGDIFDTVLVTVCLLSSVYGTVIATASEEGDESLKTANAAKGLSLLIFLRLWRVASIASPTPRNLSSSSQAANELTVLASSSVSSVRESELLERLQRQQQQTERVEQQEKRTTSELRSTKEELARVTARLSTLEEKLEEESKSKSSLKKQLRDLTSEKETIQSSSAARILKLEESLKEKSDSAFASRSLSTPLDSLKDSGESQWLNEKVKSLQGQVLALTTQLEQANERYQASLLSHDSTKSEVDGLRHQLESARELEKDLRRKLRESEEREAAAKEQRRRTATELQEEEDSLSAQLKRALAEEDDLRLQLRQNQSAHEQLKEEFDKVSSNLSSQYRQAAEAQRALEREVAALKQERQSKQLILEAQKEEIDQVTAERNDLRMKLTQLRDEMELLRANLKAVDEEKNDDRSLSERAVAEIKRDLEETRLRLRMNEEQFSTSKEQLRDSEEKRRSLEEELRSLRELRQSNSQVISELQVAFTQKGRELKELAEQMKRKEEEWMERQESENKKLHESYSQSIDSLERKLAAEKSLNEEERAREADIIRQLEVSQAEVELQLRQEREENRGLKRERDLMTQQLEKLKKEVAEGNRTLEAKARESLKAAQDFTAEIQRLKDQFIQKEEALKQSFAESQQEQDRLLDEQLKNALTAKDNTIMKLQNEVDVIGATLQDEHKARLTAEENCAKALADWKKSEEMKRWIQDQLGATQQRLLQEQMSREQAEEALARIQQGQLDAKAELEQIADLAVPPPMESNPEGSDSLTALFQKSPDSASESVVTPSDPRTRVAREILETEQSYVNFLRVVVDTYIRSLNQALHTKPIISKEEIKSIFSEIEVILNFHTLLLRQLQDKLKNWTPQALLADIFVVVHVYLQGYSQYIVNYPHALNTFKECMTTNPAFKEFIENCSKKKEGTLDLWDYLIMPVQRCPRYVLLLTELLKHTSPDHPDHLPLTEALDKVKEATQKINKVSQEAENGVQVLAIQHKIIGKIGELLVPSRVYLKEGALFLVEGSKRRRRYIFLFNDILVETKVMKNAITNSVKTQLNTLSRMSQKYVTPFLHFGAMDSGEKYKLRKLHDLKGMVLEDVKESSVPKASTSLKAAAGARLAGSVILSSSAASSATFYFRLKQTSKSGSESLTFATTSQELKDEWMAHCKKAVENVQEKANSFNKKPGRHPSSARLQVQKALPLTPPSRSSSRTLPIQRPGSSTSEPALSSHSYET